MNRKEKRALQKQLGLTRYYKNQSLIARSNRIANNIQEGNKEHAENLEKQRIALESAKSEKYNAEFTELTKKFSVDVDINEAESKAKEICKKYK